VTALPVIWLCGAPATGKSTVAWRLFHDFADWSIRVGYVDIDQLGMMCPAPQSDPDRHQAKADALAAVMPNYAHAGARLLIVSGVLDPVVGARVAARMPSIAFCHLKAAEPTIRARLADRDPQPELAEDTISMMRGLDQASFISHTVDTDGRTPHDIAREVAPLVKPLAEAPSTAGTGAAQGAGDLIVVSGPRAVGKSSVSWQVFTQKCASGVATAYADLEQLGFLRPADGDDTALRVSNLAALWNALRPLGIRSLIANGQLDGEGASLLRTRFDSASVRVVRLTASADAYRQRISQRHGGGPARLAGDDLEGAMPEHQDRILRHALEEEARHASVEPADGVIETTSLSATEIADLICQTGRP
jgi:broad-specificity NMP kinase